MDRSVLFAVCCMISSVLLLLGYPAFALQPQGANQNSPAASIAGKITIASDAGTINNLAGVTVNLTGPSVGSAPQSSVTDADGHYEFTHLVAGSYTLEASEDGFKTWSAMITLAADQALARDIVLQINSVNQQVEVREQATEIATQSSAAATSTVSSQQLDTLPLPTQKFTEALSLVPGVIRTAEGKLNFKGQAESQGMLVVDSAENVDPVSGSFSIPIPVQAIQAMTVFSLPESSAYGGFSGGLTTIETKPPSGEWEYKVLDFIPSFRGKGGEIVGIANWVPGFEFGGPIVKNKLNFSENLTYEVRKRPVRGLPWPVNETDTRSTTSFTQLQATLSPRHLLTMSVNVFPMKIEYANINQLVPQTASANYGRNGESVGISDSYQLVSGALLSTVVRYTRFNSDEYGQGPANMEITPEGWGGNFFNAWTRKANQWEAVPSYQLATKSWLGTHEIRFGADALYRSYDGSSISHPIDLLAENGSLAERIDFQGAGLLSAKDTEVAEFVEDHWNLNTHLTLNFGARLSSQSIGRDAAFAPRAGAAYSLNGGKTVIRASAAEIYGQVPLLAADFNDNQERVLSFFNSSGALVGQPTILKNTYLLAGVPASPSGMSPDPRTSPRTFTWNAEIEHEVRKNLNLRVSYLDNHTTDLFVVNSVLGATPGAGMLALESTGVSRYRQADLTVHYRANDHADLTVSYTWSQARGDLNTLADTLILFATPVIRPNASGILPTDVPHRVVASGLFHLPWWKLAFSPAADVRSGLPYSTVDVLQNYVGVPDSLRFPLYFALDVRIYREFALHLPFMEPSKTRKVRLGVYSTDVTNRHNPHDVYSNVMSPMLGQFGGFQRRFDGMVIDLIQ